MHSVELSTSAVKADIEVINTSLSQNQCVQCVTPPLAHTEISRPRDATELNILTMIKLGDVNYQAHLKEI